MPPFSHRFWNSLLALDGRLVSVSSACDRASRRLRTSRHCMTDDAQVEFRIEMVEAMRELREAVSELRSFQSRKSLQEAR